MKQKLILGLTALLAIGLFFTGCPTGNSSNDPPPPPPSDFDKLTPLTPDPINEPAGYKEFPKGTPKEEGVGGSGLLGNTAFYVTSGGEGFIEDNEDGTYKVTVVTKPGGLSAVYFQDSEYVYKTGFYLSLNLPTASAAAPHKPIGMTAFAATGPQESGTNDWTSAQRVNVTGNNTIEQTDKYLAGRVDFAWENDENLYPRKTIVLYIYWHDKEEAGAEYEFTVRKILVSDDEDLTPPAYPESAWAPSPIAPPAGWTDFPSANILASQAFAGTDTPVPGGGFVAKEGGGYTGTVPATSGGYTRITIPQTPDNSEFVKGYYISLDLPVSSADGKLKPIQVVPVAANNSNVTSWDSEKITKPPTPTQYVGGQVDIQWYSDEATKLYNSLCLDFYWHDEEPAGTYTFTLKKLMITSDDDYVPPDPDELEAWTPSAVAEPVGYVNFPGTETLDVTYYPWSTNTTGTTISTTAAGTGRTLVRLSGATFAYKKGIYVSVTLPNDSLKPEKIFVYGSTTKLEGGIVWGTETGVTAPSGKFLAGKVDLHWDGSASTDVLQGIILDIYWHDGQEAGPYSFTINSIKVAEESEEAPPAEKPGIHESSQLADATYALNATATPLKIVPNWTDNSKDYTYEWWQAESVDATWPAVGVQWSGDSYTPPTNESGTFYYYGVVTFGSEKTLTRMVTITVNP